MWRDIVFFVCLSIRFCSADVCTVTRFEDVNQATSSCQSITIKDIKIPQTTTLEINLNNGADLVFDGRITHVPAEWTGDLVVIRGSNVTISGTSNHLFDGLGPQHWKGANEPIILRPKFIRFKVHDSTIQHLNLLNCPRQCIHISSSSNVHVSDIYIDNKAGYKGVAPNNKFGHNTDGIDVSGSDSIYIKDVTVFNQDDCVAITSGSHLYFENFFCNGSHGLSLSVSGGEASNIVFKDSVVTYAKWAIHIKTHNEGTEGHIYNVLYQNITFTDVDNIGIFVQQNYPSGDVRGNVPITNLTLDSVGGTVLSKAMRISVLCAAGACSDWQWNNVAVSGSDVPDDCLNAPEGAVC